MSAVYELTPSQRKVLRFIEDQIFREGLPPTRAEIAKGIGYKSPNAVQECLKILERKGLLYLRPNISRGIRLTYGLGA
jgi:repressor LexA